MLTAKELPSGRIARKHKEDEVFSIYGSDGVTLVTVIAYEDVISLSETITFDNSDGNEADPEHYNWK